ncbi:MAG: hypothetical protein SCJ94_11340 [Bacillota bacterium]|nr:hypothetical protein [Bacillota bacterium]
MIRRFDFNGTAKEVGRQHGEALKQEIHELYQKLINYFIAGSPSSGERKS